jgi:hypothetical protein
MPNETREPREAISARTNHSLDDVREIMRVAIERMIAEACKGVIMELRSDRRTLFFV